MTNRRSNLFAFQSTLRDFSAYSTILSFEPISYKLTFPLLRGSYYLVWKLFINDLRLIDFVFLSFLNYTSYKKANIKISFNEYYDLVKTVKFESDYDVLINVLKKFKDFLFIFDDVYIPYDIYNVVGVFIIIF